MSTCRVTLFIAAASALFLAGCSYSGSMNRTLHPDSTADIQGKVGEVMSFGLPGNAGTGYTWNLTSTLPKFLEAVGEPTFVADHADMPGSSGVTKFTFKAKSVGEETLRFEYARSWEKNVAPARWAEVELVIKP